MMKQTRKTRIRIPAWPLNSFGNSRHGFFAKNIQLAHIHGQAYGAKKSSRWYCVHHLPFEVQPDSSTLFLFQHLLLYRYTNIPLFSCAPSLLPRALTHGLSRALKMWPTRRIIVQFIFTLVRFIAATKFHFTSSTADANFEHDLISAGFRVVHRVNTTRKLSRLLLPPLSTRSSFALLSRRLLVEETRWCDVSRAIGSWSPQIHVLLERVRDRKTRKTRKKKKTSFKKAHSSIPPRCRKTGLSQSLDDGRDTKMCFHFYFASLFQLLRIFSLRLVIISKLRLIITRDRALGHRSKLSELLSSHARTQLLFSPDSLGASCDGDDALFSRQFKLHDDCFFATSDLKK